MTFHLRLGHTYSDRIAPLLDGTVVPRDLSIEFVTGTADELFYRMLHGADLDAAEMSLGAHAVRVSRSQDDLVGLPVFPSRMFRHGAVYVRDSIKGAEDLAGARIGTPEYQMTASIWVRHILLTDFGVDWRSVQWSTGGLNVPGRKDRIPLRDVPGLQIAPIGDGETLTGLLEAGALDAVITPEEPEAFHKGSASRLFADFRMREADWYERTGIVPIMHLVVVRRSVLEWNPAAAEALTRALAEGQVMAWRRLRRNGNPSASLLWLDDEMAAEESLLGLNPFRYGLSRNRAALEMFLTACDQQELLSDPVSVDQLFWPDTRDMAV